MTLSEYLIEAVAYRKTGKYSRGTSLIEKISGFSGYDEIVAALSVCAKFAGSIDLSNPNTIILRKEANMGAAYITGKTRTGSLTWPVIYVCNSKRMAKITFGSADFILGVDIFEWNGAAYTPIDSYYGDYGGAIGVGVDEVKKIILESVK